MTCESIRGHIKNRFLNLRHTSLIFFLLLLSFVGYAQRAIPELWGMRVHDEAGILSQPVVQQLEQQLKTFEDSTSNQIAILIIPSLDGEVLEEYALRVAHDAWKLGQADTDNGVLLLIAVNDRKMRIEVGQGLEGVLPDAICSRIIRNEISPNFRRNDFDAGVVAGINAICKAIGGEYVADGSDLQAPEFSAKDKALISLFVFGILGVFTFTGLRTKGCAAWFLYVFLIPFYALFPGAILGFSTGIPILIVYLIAWPVLKFIFQKKGWSNLDSNSRGGGWSSGGGWYSGGSSGGGWSSGGGFSGGGGSFGGGGSSGSW